MDHVLAVILGRGCRAGSLRLSRRDAPNASGCRASIAPAVGMPGAPPTSAEGLRQRISEMENRLQERPHDTGAAVLLADALLRQARVTGDRQAAGRVRAAC